MTEQGHRRAMEGIVRDLGKVLESELSDTTTGLEAKLESTKGDA